MKIAKFHCLPLSLVLVTLGWMTCSADARSAVPQLKPGDGPTAFDQVQFWTAHRLDFSEYLLVDEAIAKYSDLNVRTIDGRPMLTGIDLAIEKFADERALDSGTLRKIQKWREKSSSSISAALVEASIWRAAAWSARGPGYASQVSEEGWKLFKTRLEKAEETLRKSQATAGKTAIWHSMYLDILLGLGKPPAEIDAAFRDAVSRFPGYDRLYYDYVRVQLPQWSGSKKQAFAVTEKVTQGGKTDADAIRYARLMWYVDKNADFGMENNSNVFELGARWDVMKRGFQLISKQYPGSLWNASNFMSYACKANDKEAFGDWREAVGTETEKYQFEIDMDMDGCEHKFRPISATQWRYERLIDTLSAPSADMIRGCHESPRTPDSDKKIVTAFGAYLAKRNLIDRMEKKEKPEELHGHRVLTPVLQKVDAKNAKAICDTFAFGPKPEAE